MGSTVIKPSRDEDWYVVWSSVAELPLAFGDRAYIRAFLHDYDDRELEARLQRADDQGTSATWADGLRFTDEFCLIFEQRGVLRRQHVKALCICIGNDSDADVADLLEPFDDEVSE
jgi:hypothetical protein